MQYKIICKKWVIGTTNSGVKFIFDYEDYSVVSQYTWCINNGYLMTWDSELKRNIYLHQLIMGTHISRDKNLVVDHINRQRLDNRKKNLRLVTYQGNSRNCSISKRNTSCYTGVTWNIGKNRWQATIRIDGKLIMLGMTKDLEQAVLLRKKAESIYF
jgi:hypothetical protein